MLIPLTWNGVTALSADLMENGALRKTWKKYSDARIETESAPLGVGPCVYTARPVDPDTGAETYDGVIKTALFMFFDEPGAGSVVCLLENADPDDLSETIGNFVSQHGGDVAAMQALKPAAT